jgi:hypothetical protein
MLETICLKQLFHLANYFAFGCVCLLRAKVRDGNKGLPDGRSKGPTRKEEKAMNRMILAANVLVLWGASVVLGASATAYSVATRGGSSNASATAYGNADATAQAAATNGGRAVANSVASANRRGYASSNAIAVADRGLAVSNSRADARGHFGGVGIANSESVAATIGGVAISNSDAQARGTFGGLARSNSYSTALSRWGVATSDSRAVAHEWMGGYADSTSDSLADTYGGVANSRVISDSEAGYHATADADGIGVSISGPRRASNANVRAVSQSTWFGNGVSRAAAIEIRP